MISDLNAISSTDHFLPDLWVRNAFRGAYLASSVAAAALWNLRTHLFSLSCIQCKNISVLGVVIKYPLSMQLATAGSAIALFAAALLLLQLYQNIRPLPRNITVSS
jgi:hypothetical protein